MEREKGGPGLDRLDGMFHATTVLAVRHGGQTVMASDGQVTFGDTVVKQSARKIRKLYSDRISPGLRAPPPIRLPVLQIRAKLEQYRGNLERSAVDSPRTGVPIACCGGSRPCSSSWMRG